MFDLDLEVQRWCKKAAPGLFLRSRRIAELEDHVHCAVASLIDEGHSQEQAFQLAIKTVGSASHLRREFRKNMGIVSFLLSQRARLRTAKPSLIVAASILIAFLFSNTTMDGSFTEWAKNTVVALCMMPLKWLTGAT